MVAAGLWKKSPQCDAMRFIWKNLNKFLSVAESVRAAPVPYCCRSMPKKKKNTKERNRTFGARASFQVNLWIAASIWMRMASGLFTSSICFRYGFRQLIVHRIRNAMLTKWNRIGRTESDEENAREARNTEHIVHAAHSHSAHTLLM